MKASVDQDTCISCELCPSICPDVFRMDDTGKAEAYVDEVPDNLLDDAKDARDSCPVSAIDVS